MDDFELIYKKYMTKIFYFVLKLSNNHYIAEEITQETFVKAYSSICSFRGECRIEVWLCQIAKNLFYDYIKDRRNKSNIGYSINESLECGCNIEKTIIIKEELEYLNKIIMSLKEPYRSVIIDYLFMEMSYKEIAIKYQKTENWVRVNFYRAKQKIIEIYNRNIEEEEIL